MGTLSDTQIVHESETQRQHIRLSLPATARLDGKEYAVKNLSAGGIILENVAGKHKPGDKLRLRLTLPFNGFSLSSPFEAEVRHYSPIGQLLGCSFANPGPQERSFLNYIIKAFIGGEIVSASGILNVVARENFTKPRMPANLNAAPPLRRQIPGLLLVAGLGILILLFLAQNLYNSVFIVRSRDGVVAGPVTPVRAPVSGTVRFKSDPSLAIMKLGQIIGTITTFTGGTPVNIVSPCNCYVTKINAAEGETVTAGEQLLSVTPVAASPWILAETDPSSAMKIKTATPVTISIFGSSTKYTGHVSSVESSLATPARPDSSVTVKVVPDQQIPVDYINRLSVVTFSTH